MFQKFFLLTLLTTVTSLAIAADQCTTWGCISTIKTLQLNSAGTIYIDVPLDKTPVNCTPYVKTYFVISKSNPYYKEVYATLLSAYLTKSKIQLRVVEGSPNCEIAYVTLSTSFEN
ncbi:hypothetical protein [Acinetobacter dispersus]|uniref:hypothetical protein n=1 Tax=Acinetobacter dispersus TaxID=70348 RepID=UPI00132E97C4|nr:hypothetical protein [Acinetobacter dispersus]QHH96427.1 hypothetical protein FPL17_02315 [Acinetobacter dispersus]